MWWLVAGLTIFCAVHLLPSMGGRLHAKLISQLGELKYKGLFALTIAGSVALIVIGWRSVPPTLMYIPPAWGYPVTLVLMVIAFYFFACASGKSNIKRFIRHPQLTGVVIWAGAHLLSNGEDRSIILFGSIGLWALLEIVAINRREGEWRKPGPLPWHTEVKPLIGGLVIMVLVVLIHPYLFGVNPVRY